MAQYSMWLSTPTGVRILPIDRIVRMQLTLATNTEGVLKVDTPLTFPLSYIQEDSRLAIWRQVPGGEKYLVGDTIFLIRDWDQVLDQSGEYASILAYTANSILDCPIVDYQSGTAYASKTDYIDDMMKAIVRENRGSLATDSDRDISDWLSVANDLSAGPSTTKAFAWRNVLAVLRELAQEADDQGSPVFFDIVSTGGIGLEFRTYTGQRGVDHSSTGAGRVVLSPRNGSLNDVRRSYTSSDERNAVTVGGRGEEEDRDLVRETNTERVNLSPFNRREIFVDARNAGAGDTAALEAEAGAALKANRPKELFSAKIRDTTAIRYGREYRFGDRVLAEYQGQVRDCRLDGVTIALERGKEDIQAELRADG